MTSPLYLIICGKHIDPYVAERNLKDMGREQTIREIASGEWGDINGTRFMISSIIEFPSDRDVTEEFIEAARMQMDSYGPSKQDRLEWEADHKRKLQAAE